jgi:hypothetical protein
MLVGWLRLIVRRKCVGNVEYPLLLLLKVHLSHPVLLLLLEEQLALLFLLLANLLLQLVQMLELLCVLWEIVRQSLLGCWGARGVVQRCLR